MPPLPPLDGRLIERAAEGLGTRDGGFLKRCLSAGLGKYARRLEALGFRDFDDVLDAGCGFGQWSLVLAQSCQRVEAIDVDERRVVAARVLAESQENLRVNAGSLEELKFPDASFDAVFCYSVVYYTDVRRSVSELCRVLRPGGRIYLCSNGPGWYLYNFVKQPHKSHDFYPRRYAVDSALATARYLCGGRPPRDGQSVITTRRWMAGELRKHGVEVQASGAEGSISVVSGMQPEPFFRGSYAGMECVSEWLGERSVVCKQQLRRAA